MAYFNKEKIQECAEWVRVNGLMEYGGAKLKEFCLAFNIDAKTYYRWLKKADFANAIKKAKEDFKCTLERDIVISLARVAKGYDYDEVKTEFENVNNEPRPKKKIIVKKHVEPNVGAAIFILTNINPKQWQNKQNQQLTIRNKNGEEMTQQEIEQELERLSKLNENHRVVFENYTDGE